MRQYLEASNSNSFSFLNSFISMASNTLWFIRTWQKWTLLRWEISLLFRHIFCIRWLNTVSTASEPVKQSSYVHKWCLLLFISTWVWREWIIPSHSWVAWKGPEHPGKRKLNMFLTNTYLGYTKIFVFQFWLDAFLWHIYCHCLS